MTFTPNKPVETNEAKIVVDPGLPAGRHRFQLVVVNRRGQRSRPTEVVVTIENRGPIR